MAYILLGDTHDHVHAVFSEIQHEEGGLSGELFASTKNIFIFLGIFFGIFFVKFILTSVLFIILERKSRTIIDRFGIFI